MPESKKQKMATLGGSNYTSPKLFRGTNQQLRDGVAGMVLLRSRHYSFYKEKPVDNEDTLSLADPYASFQLVIVDKEGCTMQVTHCHRRSVYFSNVTPVCPGRVFG
jgi:hypothetical protein